jgi:hypothetical protein
MHRQREVISARGSVKKDNTLLRYKNSIFNKAQNFYITD